MLTARSSLLAGLASALSSLPAALLAGAGALLTLPSLLPTRLLGVFAAGLARALIALVAVAVLRA
jgi:hypothetical protein